MAKQSLVRRRWLATNAETLEPLVRHTVPAIQTRKFDAMGLSLTAHGAARSGRVECLEALFTALATAVKSRVGEFNAQGLANTAWAFATAGQVDAQLF